MAVEDNTGTPKRARMAGLFLAVGLAFALSLSGSALKSIVQVYFSDIAHGLSVGLGTFAWATTLFAIGIAVASPIVGYLADRFGGAPVLVFGTILAALTFLACAAAPSAFAFAPVYGMLGSIAYTMLSYVPLGKLADEVFANRGEGLAYSVMTNGPAVGFMVLVPLWVWLGTFLSWRTVFAIAGAFMLVVLTPVALFLRASLAEDTQNTEDSETLATSISIAARLRPILSNGRYVALAVSFGGCGVTMAFIDVHMVNSMHMAGVGPSAISGAVFLLGLLEIVGALVAGRLCDSGYVRQTLVAGYGLRGCAMLLGAVAPTAVSSLAFGALFGASYMATVVATTLWVSRLLPAESRATAMGLVWTVHSGGAALSSQGGAVIAERLHSYTLVSLVEALVAFASMAIVLAVWLRERGAREQLVQPDR